MSRSTETDPADGDPRPVLRATGLEKTYHSGLPIVGRSVPVLRGTDLSLYPGEIVGIVGENGSGKSTLMKILVGALEPDAGEVSGDVSIGWCPQETLLYDRLTVEETFELFGEAYGMTDDRVRTRRDELASQLGFESYLDYRVDQLSGGNRQKVNLAIALVHEPALLLLDEPYTGFDWETYLGFWDLSERLVDEGTTIAIISHLISERERFDRILELRDGRLEERGESPPQSRSSAHDAVSGGTDGDAE
ncbi:MAG: ABC transporter ATP-binding protein [Halanaeroarchaeum sp.]